MCVYLFALFKFTHMHYITLCVYIKMILHRWLILLFQGMQFIKVNIANRSSFAATSSNLSETRVSVWKAA